MTMSKRVSKQNKYRRDIVQSNKQRGVVLVVSLIFLIALTAVASALMLNTTTDMKMSGASEMQVVAKQEAFGAMDELIFRQVQPSNGAVNSFALPIATYQNPIPRNVLPSLVSTNVGTDIVSADVRIMNNQYMKETGCPRTLAINTNSANLETCNILQVQLTKLYGRKSNSNVQVNAGIVQKLGKL
ncbi:MAG: type IV pilus assembly protein PilX [Colwellia sp.]|jgi:type IV pilus assembly protein PilX